MIGVLAPRYLAAQCAASTITSISPGGGYPVSGNITVTVNGSNFVNGQSVVVLNGFTEGEIQLTTAFVSSTQLTATLPGSLLIHAVNDEQTWNLDILVSNTACGNASSNQLAFGIYDIILPSVSIVVAPGESTTYRSGIYSYTSAAMPFPVTMSCAGLPAGATCAFTPNPVNPCGASGCTSLSLTVTADANTPPGKYSFTLQGTSGGLTRSTSATLTVGNTAGPALGVASPPAMMTGPNGSLAIELAPQAAFTFAVAVSNIGAPGSTLNWSATAATAPAGGTWLSVNPAQGTNNGDFVVSLSPGLSAGTYSGTITVSAPGAGNSPQNIPITLTVGPHAPFVASGQIVPLYSTVPTIQPGEWVSIYGVNLASSTANWTGNFPTSLNGTSVSVNGKAAYLSYVSASQINFQAPDDTATGSVQVVITTPDGTAASSVVLAQYGPSFCLLDGKHVAAIIPRSDGSGAYGGGTYDIVGPTGNSLGYPTVAAKAGDTVELFAVGLGPTDPAVAAGQAYSGAAQTANPVTLLINNSSITPAFAGLSSAGLYQINLTVPSGIGTGDVSLVATAGGVQTPSNVVLSLQ